MKRLLLLPVIVLALAGCKVGADDKHGIGDAPVGDKLEAPREVIVMPDTYGNVASACDGHGHRVYVMTADVPPVVVADEACR